jgi:hypothetical protein
VNGMSASLTSPNAAEWNYRATDKRLVIVKTKNVSVLKVAVLDVLTNLLFAIEVQNKALLDSLAIDKEYLANLKVYTSTNLQGVDKDFINFFQAVDIDQEIEDFIKAYWIYPAKIRFELVEAEEP